jgi:two-component system cell cycle sensor histidine kinase/response regulator CckA
MLTAPEPKAILVVDDDFSVLTMIKCMLETGNYKVLVARTPDVAISISERNSAIDLLLVDVMMPDVSGPDLAKKILAIHNTAKVLFMSGYAESDALRENVGMVGFLPKPFTSSALRARIDQLFSSELSAAVSARTAS